MRYIPDSGHFVMLVPWFQQLIVLVMNFTAYVVRIFTAVNPNLKRALIHSLSFIQFNEMIGIKRY